MSAGRSPDRGNATPAPRRAPAFSWCPPPQALDGTYTTGAQDFGSAQPKTDWSAVEHEMLGVIDIEKLLAVELATVEKGKGA